MIKQGLIILSLLSITITGCSDYKAANEANFKVAIQAYLDKTYPYCYLETKFPTDGKVGFLNNDHAILNYFVSLGVVSVKDELYNGEIKPIYNLTDKGKEVFKSNIEQDMKGNQLGGFCFGKATVKEVVNFTEPSDKFGYAVSKVKFTYTVDFPSWVKPLEINIPRASLPNVKKLKTDLKSQTTPIEDAAILGLTNKGWVHKKLF